MGWLRELMDLTSPPIDGYGELARRALAHPEWPADTQPRARSLAALFSKLDRGIELEWLADREAAQRALALVLGCPFESVRRAVAPEEDGTPGRVRFLDLPYARPFDLREEPLPPGIPELVRNPAGWDRVWWRAPSGSGRTLSGQWLGARGLARFASARRVEDVLDRLGASGPWLIEIEQVDSLEAIARLPERGVCVAAPCPAPAGLGWRPIESPPLPEVLPALLAWIEARVPSDGAFEAAAAEAWLAPSVADGTLPTLGAVLGAAGLLDARGVREARGKTLLELAESFVNERLEDASLKGSAEAQWLRRHGFGALVKLAESALTTGAEPWERPRSQDEWIALVPAELEKSVDSEWVRWSAARSGGEASLRAVERALREAPPGAYRLIRALVDARLLAERGPGRLSVAPEFLKYAALARARDALVREASPFAWGEALLRPHAAPSLLEALFARVAADDVGPLLQLAELDVPSHPALVVAAEAALVCLGLHALSGAEVPTELLATIVSEQLAVLVELPLDLPRPRLLASAPGDACPLALHGVWLLAMLAATEPLDDARATHPLLCPWSEEQPPDGLLRVLDVIYATLARPEVAGQSWAAEGFALAGRLLESTFEGDELPDEGLELQPAAPSPHPLGRPARLVQALLDGDLPGQWLRGFGEHPLELRALQAACALRRVSWPRMAHALWKSWQASGCRADAELPFLPDGPYRDQLWPHLPPEVLAAVWTRWVAADVPWPFECFAASQWSAFVERFAERWQQAPRSLVWQAAFERMDLAHLTRAIEAGGLLHPSAEGAAPLLASACRRYPGWLSAKLRESASSADDGAFGTLLHAAPRELCDELVRVLSEELSRRSTQRSILDAARTWLHVLITARRGDFRRTYALFVEIEQRLARARRASGR